MKLAGTEEESGRFAFSVLVKGKAKHYAWSWLERVAPKAARVPNASVLALRVADLGQKDLMLQAAPEKFFTEPHYNGYPAVLLRLSTVRAPELRTLLTDAWQCVAVKAKKRAAPVRGKKQVARRRKGTS